MKRHKNKLTVSVLIILMISIFSTCINKKTDSNDARGITYIGSAKCINCHKNIFDTYTSTSHYLSSRPASKDAIKGSFSPDSNAFYYRPALKVAMEQRDSGFFQVAYIDNVEKQAHRFDIVFGSGRKGQSYAYWMGNYIFQLPVSYFAPENSWVNSPNYPPHNVKFDRNITIGCFECHSSYINKTFEEISGDQVINQFDKNQIVYGIDCERCHGPSASHVNFHEENPLEKKPRYIALSSTLTNDEKLAMCAMCHSGPRETYKSTFDFVPGDKLSKYVHQDTSSVNTTEIDVHGKQYQLLAKSQCFIKSKVMNCSSCHNTHVKERDNLALFSQRCMNCHKPDNHNFCKLAPSTGNNIVNNCIDCHMPAKPSSLITLMSQDQTKPNSAFVRTHYISVYPKETKKFLENIK